MYSFICYRYCGFFIGKNCIRGCFSFWGRCVLLSGIFSGTGLRVSARDTGTFGQKPYSKSPSVGAMGWLLMRGSCGFQPGVRGMWNGCWQRAQDMGNASVSYA